MKNTNDKELRKDLKEFVDVKNNFQLATLQSGNYEEAVDDMFEWLASYPKEYGYSRLYETFCRNIQAVKSCRDVLDMLDAQVFLVLNFETFFKLVLLSVGSMTEEELSEDQLVLSDCRDRLLVQLQKFQIKPEVIERFKSNFSIVKEIRNNGAHKYMHDDQLQILKLVTNINSTLSGYLIVFYFKKVLETGMRLEKEVTILEPVSVSVSAPAPVLVPASVSVETCDLAALKEMVSNGKASEAITRAVVLAGDGDRDTQEFLAKVLANPPKDSGIVKDIKEAVKWNVKLANSGDVKAMHRLGDLYKSLKQYNMVIKYYKDAAQRGNVSSLVCLGNLYFNGVTGQGNHSIRQDLTKAKAYFEQAVAAGNQDAASKLKEIERRLGDVSDTSVVLTDGSSLAQTVKTNYEKAIACLSQKKLEDALRLMKEAVSDENEHTVLALRWLVKAYGGKYGVEKNSDEALKYIRTLAGKNDPEGLFRLGLHYRTEKKYSTCISWFKKSAALGYVNAFMSLGYVYGNGVQEEGMTHVKVNKAEAFKWYYKAAESGKASAQYLIALMYEKGEGVTLDVALAIEWCEQAAGQGYQSAIDRLEEWKSRGLLDMVGDSIR